MTDTYHSSSNQTTPAGSDLKSPRSVRTTATPELGVSIIKRPTSNEHCYAESIGAYDPAEMIPNVSMATTNAVHRQSNTSSYRSRQLLKNTYPDSTAQRPGSSHITMPGNDRAHSIYNDLRSQGNPSFLPIQDGIPHVSNEPHQQFSPFNLPPPIYPSMTPASQEQQIMFSSTPINPPSHLAGYSHEDTNGEYGAPSASQFTVPNFEGNGYNRSPLAMADDFTAWLFNEPYPSNSSPGHRPGSMSVGASAFVDDFGINGQYNTAQNGNVSQSVNSVPQQHPMAVKSILDPTSLHAVLSEKRRRELIKFIEIHFTDHVFIEQKQSIMNRGDVESESHVLSLQNMQIYLGSYWYHFHPQMPILHKPSFSADKAQDLLLFAMIAIGASCLDKIHGLAVTQAGAELANFLAWHLRGEIFKDKDFLPPAKLWVFQTLLLLEIYEKMYSDRKLHERAHIHHGTTLTLMRRGSSLIGRSALDSPPLVKDRRTGLMAAAQTASDGADPEEWWNHWIINEATRRVAFAAFIIDSIHATMFGHSATMVAHEMKLALPCDESLWSATSSAEVARIEAKLHAQGMKSMTFFEGLKDTLKGKPVQTNSFGRTAIMAGLLSVTWHMNQRDVQIHHLGALKALGGKDIWRSPLTKAFDSWKNDFDQTVGIDGNNLPYSTGRLDEENIFESRTVLHHLAHMAMHVDVVSCQIFAKATRLLGRTTLPSDYEIAQKRIRNNWAPRASARHATFYALKFLRQVLMPNSAGSYRGYSTENGVAISPYSARDDFLLNRPWVLYYAVLIVWSYGYALDGPLISPQSLSTSDQQHADMVLFLTRVGGITAPIELERTRGRNDCLGLLYVLRDKFQTCRWELLHEAANLLDNCIKMLRGIV